MIKTTINLPPQHTGNLQIINKYYDTKELHDPLYMPNFDVITKPGGTDIVLCVD